MPSLRYQLLKLCVLTMEYGQHCQYSVSIQNTHISRLNTQCPFKTRTSHAFKRQLISRFVRSKVHIIKSKFHDKIHPEHQKTKRVTINLQKRLNTEIKKPPHEGQIEKNQ